MVGHRISGLRRALVPATVVPGVAGIAVQLFVRLPLADLAHRGGRAIGDACPARYVGGNSIPDLIGGTRSCTLVYRGGWQFVGDVLAFGWLAVLVALLAPRVTQWAGGGAAHSSRWWRC